jgi:hypothetical protein
MFVYLFIIESYTVNYEIRKANEKNKILKQNNEISIVLGEFLKVDLI